MESFDRDVLLTVFEFLVILNLKSEFAHSLLRQIPLHPKLLHALAEEPQELFIRHPSERTVLVTFPPPAELLFYCTKCIGFVGVGTAKPLEGDGH